MVLLFKPYFEKRENDANPHLVSVSIESRNGNTDVCITFRLLPTSKL